MKTKGRRQSKNVKESVSITFDKSVDPNRLKLEQKALENSRLTDKRPISKNSDMNIKDIIKASDPVDLKKKPKMETLRESYPTQKKLDKNYKPSKSEVQHLEVKDITPKKTK